MPRPFAVLGPAPLTPLRSKPVFFAGPGIPPLEFSSFPQGRRHPSESTQMTHGVWPRLSHVDVNGGRPNSGPVVVEGGCWEGCPNPPGGSEGIIFGEASHPGPPRDVRQLGAPTVGVGGRAPTRERRDLPERRWSNRGALPDLSEDSLREVMWDDLHTAMFAPSSRASRDSVWATLRRICEGWGLGEPIPLTTTIFCRRRDVAGGRLQVPPQLHQPPLPRGRAGGGGGRPPRRATRASRREACLRSRPGRSS